MYIRGTLREVAYWKVATMIKLGRTIEAEAFKGYENNELLSSDEVMALLVNEVNRLYTVGQIKTILNICYDLIFT